MAANECMHTVDKSVHCCKCNSDCDAYPDQVVMTATAMRIKTPGIRPRMSKAPGIERAPMPICVLIMMTAVPTQPTYSMSGTGYL